MLSLGGDRERQSRSEAWPKARRVVGEFQTARFGISPVAFPDYPRHVDDLARGYVDRLLRQQEALGNEARV